jgi:hypothetical protein
MLGRRARFVSGVTDLDNRDIIGSTLLGSVGLLVFAMSFGYGIGTFSEMGAGFFPMVLGGLAILLALSIGIPAVWRTAPAMARPSWRALIGIAVAIAVFALTVERFGALPAIALAAIIVGASSRDSRPMEVIALAAFLVLMIWVVFFLLLGMPLTAFRLS